MPQPRRLAVTEEPAPAQVDSPLVPRMLLALLIGFISLPFVLTLDYPDYGSLRTRLEILLAQTDIPAEQYDVIALFVAGAVFVMVALLLRRVLFRTILRVPILAALFCGAFFWIPFGNHIYAAVPQLETRFPEFRTQLDEAVTRVAAARRIRNAVEAVYPPAMQPPPIVEAAPQLPQIGN